MGLQQKRMPKACVTSVVFSIFPLFGPRNLGITPLFSFQKKQNINTPLNQVHATISTTRVRFWAPLVADRIAAAFPKAHVSHEAWDERIFDCLNFSATLRRKFRRKMPEKDLDYPRFPEEKFRRNHNSWMSTNLSCTQILKNFHR